MGVDNTYSETWLVGSKSCVLGEIVSPRFPVHDKNNNIPVEFREWDAEREAADWPHLPVLPPDIPLEILPWVKASVLAGRNVVLHGLPQDHGDDAAGTKMAYPISPSAGIDLKFSLHRRDTLFGFQNFSENVALPLINGSDVQPFIEEDRKYWVVMQREMAEFVAQNAADNALVIWNSNHVQAFQFPKFLQHSARAAKKSFGISAILHSPFVGQPESALLSSDVQRFYKSSLINVGNGRVRWSMPDAKSVGKFAQAYEAAVGKLPPTLPTVSPALSNNPESGAAFIEHAAATALNFKPRDLGLGDLSSLDR